MAPADLYDLSWQHIDDAGYAAAWVVERLWYKVVARVTVWAPRPRHSIDSVVVVDGRRGGSESAALFRLFVAHRAVTKTCSREVFAAVARLDRARVLVEALVLVVSRLQPRRRPGGLARALEPSFMGDLLKCRPEQAARDRELMRAIERRIPSSVSWADVDLDTLADKPCRDALKAVFNWLTSLYDYAAARQADGVEHELPPLRRASGSDAFDRPRRPLATRAASSSCVDGGRLPRCRRSRA